MLKQWRECLSVACLGMVLAGCAEAPEGEPNEEASQAEWVDYEAADILALLQQELRVASASEPAQCRVLPVGQKPCGGPERFVLFSTQTADEDKILRLVDAYNRAQVQDPDMVSDCQVLEPPRVVLRDGLCRVMPASRY
ncbi:MAG: hypothetical protein C0463_08660 [Idiomarina sp.]|nr:hypothetical protein [Idiomarina sp.]